ncbi:MAG: UDP-glucose/GDP-mannose dehydrogenase family protein [bacterium]|nr:UDP-glucose/GDP-mannose dehydrogenase family protein [bacterium]
MRVTIVGPGYVGLPSAVVFAGLGHHVFLLGNIPEQVERLQKGEIHLHEPGLAESFRDLVREGKIVPTLSYADAIPSADVVVIAVGTPSGKYGEADLRYVFAAVRDLAEHLSDYTVVAMKSTVPVGTAEKVREIISAVILSSPPPLAGPRWKRWAKDLDSSPPKADQNDRPITFDVASCPEFLREGTALFDTKNPDRIVIGVTSDKARDLLLELHQELPGERVVTDPKSAECIKYASNAFLATKISFINEIANICEGVGADVTEVARGMGLDSRIGSKFLKAGLGWSGSCFPKDVRALHHIAFSNNYEPQILKAAIEVNNDQRRRLVAKLHAALGGDLQGKTIAILGLAFKPHTDDIRESAAIDLIYLLQQKGAHVRVHDPVARPDDRDVFKDVRFMDSAQDAVRDADAVVIATEWPEFKELDWRALRAIVRNPFIADGRNLLDPKLMRAAGWKYASVGRP